jgi:hypothetical protein
MRLVTAKFGEIRAALDQRLQMLAARLGITVETLRASFPNGIRLVKGWTHIIGYNTDTQTLDINVDVLFNNEIVRQCFADRLTIKDLPRNAIIIIGFDHAVSGGDESVAWVGALVNGILWEIETRTWLNTYIHDQATELHKSYPQALYCIDGTAEGGKEAVGTFERLGLNVTPIDFGRSKQTLMLVLKDSMQRKLAHYADEGLRVQLSHYKFRESATKGRYVFGQKGTPDDRVDAFALANYLAHGSGGANYSDLPVLTQSK